MTESPVKTRVDPKEYRKPLVVTKWRAFGPEGYEYPVCPRCNRTFEREYQRFCDRCGQRLAWRISLKKPR